MMTALRERISKNLMASTWTKAGQVRRKFRAGPPLRKDRVLSPTTAIFETCILLDNFRGKMHEAELEPDDVSAYLVVASAKKQGDWLLGGAIRIPEATKIGEVFRKVEAIKSPVMLGVVFKQIDHDPKAKERESVWSHPFLTGPDAQRMLSQAVKKVEEGETKH